MPKDRLVQVVGMCEFKVFDRNQVMAEDIVYASLSNGVMILKDVLGSATRAEGVIVTEIDVANEAMTLKRDPLIGDMLRFLEDVAKCEESGRYDNALEETWLKVKSRGDERIRELWRKYEDTTERRAPSDEDSCGR